MFIQEKKIVTTIWMLMMNDCIHFSSLDSPRIKCVKLLECIIVSRYLFARPILQTLSTMISPSLSLTPNLPSQSSDYRYLIEQTHCLPILSLGWVVGMKTCAKTPHLPESWRKKPQRFCLRTQPTLALPKSEITLQFECYHHEKHLDQQELLCVVVDECLRWWRWRAQYVNLSLCSC